MPTLFLNQTTDGDSDPVDWNGNKPGGLQVSGVWNGATITIKGSYNDGLSYLSPAGGAYTEDHIGPLEMPTGKVKATLSDAGASTNLSLYISPG
jgi:hypothetical protein